MSNTFVFVMTIKCRFGAHWELGKVYRQSQANRKHFNIEWIWRFYRTGGKPMINRRGKGEMTLGLRKHKIFSSLIPYKLREELKAHFREPCICHTVRKSPHRSILGEGMPEG